jgi:hypothetical protein
MRKIILFFICSCITAQTQAQVTSAGMGTEFKEISGFGRTQSGFEGLQTYKSGSVIGSQFFNDSWTSGSVTGSNRETISINYLFLYDKVRQDLYIRPKDTNLIILADKNQVVSFVINTDKPHLFNNASIYDPNQKGNFFEMLVENDNYTFLKLTQATFKKADPNDMEKVKNGEFQDEFVDHVTYYLYHNNKAEKIKLNEPALRKAFKEQQAKVDDFFSTNSNSEVNEQLAINLVNTINSK